MSSCTVTSTQTFTITHARYLSSKMATDLTRMQRFYNQPSDVMIYAFEKEMLEWLLAGYLSEVTYGFMRCGKWMPPTVSYSAHELLSTSYDDDDPGGIKPGYDVLGATFCSFLDPNSKFNSLSPEGQHSFEASLPFRRTHGCESTAYGSFLSDRCYTSGARALHRKSLVPC